MNRIYYIFSNNSLKHNIKRYLHIFFHFINEPTTKLSPAPWAREGWTTMNISKVTKYKG